MGKVFASTFFKYGVLVALVVTGLIYWINWSFDMSTTVTNQKTTIEARDKTIAELREEIDDYITGKKSTDKGFAEIDESQIDLLCAARNQTPVLTVAPKPEVVEVVKWRDRATQCPTTDPEKAEPFDPAVAELRPVNEEIAMQSLNNTWKAYCLATKNEDEICAPFR